MEKEIFSAGAVGGINKIRLWLAVVTAEEGTCLRFDTRCAQPCTQPAGTAKVDTINNTWPVVQANTI